MFYKYEYVDLKRKKMSEILKNKKANKQKYIAFRVSEQEEIFFKKQAEELGLSISEFARQILFKNQSVVEQDQNQIEYIKNLNQQQQSQNELINKLINQNTFISNQQKFQNEVFRNQSFVSEVIKLICLSEFKVTETEKAKLAEIANEKVRKLVKDLELP